MEWGRQKSDAAVPAIQQTPENRDVKRFRGWRLLSLLSTKQTLTVFA